VVEEGLGDLVERAILALVPTPPALPSVAVLERSKRLPPATSSSKSTNARRSGRSTTGVEVATANAPLSGEGGAVDGKPRIDGGTLNRLPEEELLAVR